jgi:pSer/pThr/pTyr-binding forkhead associated (FHA) protein
MGTPASSGEPSTAKVPTAIPRTVRDGFAIVAAVGRERGVRAVLEKDEPVTIFIGRAPECAIRLRDELVSRRHARLVWTGDVLHIVDVDSANGTLVDGVPITSARLRGGETIVVGTTLLNVTAIVSPKTSALAQGY